MSQPPSSSEEHKPAPAELLAVQSLVNTRDLELGTDALADDADARRWVADAGLIGTSKKPSKADLRLLREVRESLRAMLAHNSGGPAPSAKQLEPINRLGDSAVAKLRAVRAGQIELGGRSDDLRAGLLGLLLRVRDAQLDGSWPKLKLCANPDCRWAFYDRSRNHQGTWCRMEVCGNRLKNRRLRARRR